MWLCMPGLMIELKRGECENNEPGCIVPARLYFEVQCLSIPVFAGLGLDLRLGFERCLECGEFFIGDA